MRHALVVDSGAGLDGAWARQGLACATRAGLARPPIPQGGLGCGLSSVGGSLAPLAANVGGTARPMALPGPIEPGAAVDDGRGVASIGWVGADCIGTGHVGTGHIGSGHIGTRYGGTGYVGVRRVGEAF